MPAQMILSHSLQLVGVQHYLAHSGCIVEESVGIWLQKAFDIHCLDRTSEVDIEPVIGPHCNNYLLHHFALP